MSGGVEGSRGEIPVIPSDPFTCNWYETGITRIMKTILSVLMTLLLAAGTGYSALLTVDFEGQTVSAAPTGAVHVSPTTPGATNYVKVVTNTPMGTGLGVEFSGSGLGLEYNVAAQSALRVDLSFAVLNAGGSSSKYLTLATGQYSASTSSTLGGSTKRYSEMRFYGDADLTFYLNGVSTTFNDLAMDSVNTITWIMNDYDVQSVNYAMGGTVCTLPANSVAWWVNGALIVQGSIDVNDSTVNGTVGTSEGNLGRVGFLGGGLESVFTFDNIVVTQISKSAMLTVEDLAVDEQHTNRTINLPVTLTTIASVPVTVDWTTMNGTALAEQDYTAVSGSLLFAVGETLKIISIPILGDDIEETDERFQVVLSNAAGAPIARDTATVTLINDDFTPSFSVASPAVIETDTGTNMTLNFVVELNPPAKQAATVQYATVDGSAKAGIDYVAVSGQLNFNAGESNKTIQVTVLGDSKEESTETFLLQLSNPTVYGMNNDSATGRIYDNDGGKGVEGYATNLGREFDIRSTNRLAPDAALYDWSKAGYRGNGVIPDNSKRTYLIDATTFGVTANDDLDDSAALQSAIDHVLTLSRDYDHLAVVELPSGTINISKQIDMHVSFMVLKGQGGDPTLSSVTRLVFKPDTNTWYDLLNTTNSESGVGILPDFDNMQYNGDSLGFIWPGRGMLKVQTLNVDSDYASSYASAPENRKDMYEGSVNFHWKSGLDVLQNGRLVAAAGSTVIPFNSTVNQSAIDALQPGMYVAVKAANTKKMYQEQGVASRYWLDLYMKMQIFCLAEVNYATRTVTLDRPLEFNLYANNTADGSSIISLSDRRSRVVPLTVVEGIGFEDLFMTLPLTGLPVLNGGTYEVTAGDVKNVYNNPAPEYALHGIVFKWAINCWVRNVHTYMTGSHAIVTEEAKNIQIEDSVFQGSWNKGAGGNGYFRCSRLWDSLIHNNTLQDLRHLTMQWSSSGNVVIGNHLDCDINFHGGWERYNLAEQNQSRVPAEHGPWAGTTWYPIWWAAGPHAGKWSGSSGPRNVLFNNDMAKQEETGGSFLPYTIYTTESTAPHRLIQMGWDHDTAQGSRWQPLQDTNGMLQTWSDGESIDFSVDPYGGVNAQMSYSGASLFLKPENNSYRSWAIAHFGRSAVENSSLNTGTAADPDGDAQPNLAEYAFAGDPVLPDEVGSTIAMRVRNGVMELDFPCNRNASDLTYELMRSTNLRDWVVAAPSTFTELVQNENLDGNFLFKLNRYAAPIDAAYSNMFYKINARYSGR